MCWNLRMSVGRRSERREGGQLRRELVREKRRRDSREHLNHFSSSKIIAETPFQAISRSRITSTSSSVRAGMSSAADERDEKRTRTKVSAGGETRTRERRNRGPTELEVGLMGCWRSDWCSRVGRIRRSWCRGRLRNGIEDEFEEDDDGCWKR